LCFCTWGLWFTLVVSYVMICGMTDSQRIYLDYAAATPLLPAAFAAMKPYLEGNFGNPSAIHSEGVTARAAVESAREAIALTVQVRPEFVTFTGGGTEGNNLAIFGVIEAWRQSGRAYADMEVITTQIEHPSIAVAMERLRTLGVQVKFVEVDQTGKIVLSHLKELLSAHSVLVSVAYANSETGTIQPLHAIKKALRESEKNYQHQVALHVDAAQAPLWVSCLFTTVGADVLVLDFAKCHGPKGTGALIRSRRTDLAANVYGGGQESALRPGTENVPGIVGAAVAFADAQHNWKERVERVSLVRDQGIKLLQTAIPTLVINGASGAERLANNINVSIPGLDTEFAAVVLDSKGFAVSTKSACAGAGGGASVVVLKTTGDAARAADGAVARAAAADGDGDAVRAAGGTAHAADADDDGDEVLAGGLGADGDGRAAAGGSARAPTARSRTAMPADERKRRRAAAEQARRVRLRQAVSAAETAVAQNEPLADEQQRVLGARDRKRSREHDRTKRAAAATAQMAAGGLRRPRSPTATNAKSSQSQRRDRSFGGLAASATRKTNKCVDIKFSFVTFYYLKMN